MLFHYFDIPLKIKTVYGKFLTNRSVDCVEND